MLFSVQTPSTRYGSMAFMILYIMMTITITEVQSKNNGTIHSVVVVVLPSLLLFCYDDTREYSKEYIVLPHYHHYTLECVPTYSYS